MIITNKDSSVAILNKDYSFINTISIKKAILLIEKGKVTVEKNSSIFINTVNNKIYIPLVVRLKKFVDILYKRKIVWRNKNVFVRDDFTCMYCGKTNLEGKDLTVDHIVPVSKGGKDTYENTVTACRACNVYKADRSMEDMDMYFIRPNFKPYAPSYMEYIMKREKKTIEKLNLF